MFHRAPWVPALLALACLMGPGASAAEPGSHEISLGLTSFGYRSFLRFSPIMYAGELAWHHPLAREGALRGLVVGAGLRGGPVPAYTPVRVPLEGFARLRLRARVGAWEPEAGPEVGLSGFTTVYTRPLPAETEDAVEERYFSRVYVAFGAAPLRWRLGRVTLSALEFHVATCSWPPGALVRLHVGLFSAGVSL
ncbi:hypothetical protein BO221_26540 [Archangium sp. Cb G35]|uniref:hypothetical protein n=1 Tax=Archangium sp. Cb G35 TaxID=1920190 RepID=UPI0009358BDF|nr:hypothetical protein [Archangium sp. Cb G35]OJT21383.1 hypothetical protein BO221_26540 [Archangium sp. Cb G35]